MDDVLLRNKGHGDTPHVFYLDNTSVIIEGSVTKADDVQQPEEVKDLEWINVQSISWSRLAALFQQGKGSWVYYQR